MTATLPPPPNAPLPEMQTKPAPPLDKQVKVNIRHLIRVLGGEAPVAPSHCYLLSAQDCMTKRYKTPNHKP